ncbi:DUF2239 family protein [Phenylobacterium sp.]|uniref:DUF2239 family protein n=1 Tax=Phenylobacterium sp. TaxID=1871053 RepID=UPI00281148B1|nr:DUF2239 family protein [Phenylobacterium sp.]
MPFTAFEGTRQLASGDLTVVSETARQALARGAARVLILDDDTGAQLDLPAGAETDSPAPERPARGRPKLGVVAREVTLLPRHWEWLATQPGGASAALRRLVEEARRASQHTDQAREAQTAVYRAMSVLAGDLPGYEEALRALYARNDSRFDDLIADWPADVGAYIGRLAAAERQMRAPA